MNCKPQVKACKSDCLNSQSGSKRLTFDVKAVQRLHTELLAASSRNLAIKSSSGSMPRSSDKLFGVTFSIHGPLSFKVSSQPSHIDYIQLPTSSRRAQRASFQKPCCLRHVSGGQAGRLARVACVSDRPSSFISRLVNRVGWQ